MVRWAADTAVAWKGCTKQPCHPEGAFFAPKDLCISEAPLARAGLFVGASTFANRYTRFMAISEITPSAVKIDKLIARVAQGDIKIPAFQRHFVWDQEQVIELLDSIYHDYPIGSILLWNSDYKLKATRNICGFAIPDRPENEKEPGRTGR